MPPNRPSDSHERTNYCVSSAQKYGLSKHILGVAPNLTPSQAQREQPFDWGFYFRRHTTVPIKTYSERYANEPEVIAVSNPEMVAQADAILAAMKTTITNHDIEGTRSLMIQLRALFDHTD